MKKTVVVMSGGSALGSREIGCLEELERQGKLKGVKDFYGVSVGALNAMGMAYLGIKGLRKVWDGIEKFSDILKFNWVTLGPVLGLGVFSTKPLRKLIDQVLSSNKNLGRATATFVDVETGGIVHVNSKDVDAIDFGDAVEASAAQPVIMTAVKGKWVDGGVRDITPLKQAIKDGAEKIIVILASPWGKNPPKWEMPKVVWYKPWTWFCRSIALLNRTIGIMLHEIFVQDIKACLVKNGDSRYKEIEIELYAPTDNSVEAFGFNQENIQKGIKQGHEMAKNGPVEI